MAGSRPHAITHQSTPKAPLSEAGARRIHPVNSAFNWSGGTMRLPLRLKTILLASVVVVISFFASLKALDWLSPRAPINAPAITALPPLPPASRTSVVLAPVAISIAAIRDAADRAAPHNFNGKADNPATQILQNADIGWTASRGPISATGAADVLTLAAPLTGV